MQRRKLLKAVGAAGTATLAATAGCTSILDCGPGEETIKDIETDPESYADDTYVIEAEIVDANEGGVGVIVDDTTAEAKLHPEPGYRFGKDILDAGTCIEAPVTARPESSDGGRVVVVEYGLELS